MPSLKKFFEAVNYEITDGFKYGWDCFGKNAFALDAGSIGHNYCWSSTVVYDLETQQVRQITFYDRNDDNVRPCRWTHPDYIAKEKREAKKRGFRYNQAYDDVDYEEVSEKEIFARIEAIVKKKKQKKKKG